MSTSNLKMLGLIAAVFSLLAVPVMAQGFFDNGIVGPLIAALVNAFIIFILLYLASIFFEKALEITAFKTKLWAIIGVLLSLVLGWLEMQKDGFIWNSPLLTGLIHIKVIVNLIVVVAFFYWIGTLVFKDKLDSLKSTKIAFFFFLLIFSYTIISHYPGFKPYDNNTYQYIWERPFVGQGKLYLFGTTESDEYARYYSKQAYLTLGGKTSSDGDTSTATDRRYGIFTGYALWAFLGMLFCWYIIFTKLAHLDEGGSKWLVWIITILISAQFASKGVTISTVIAFIQVVFVLIFRDGFKKGNMHEGQAWLWSIAIVWYLSWMLIPDGYGFWSAATSKTFFNDEEGFLGISWIKLIITLLIGIPMLLTILAKFGLRKGQKNREGMSKLVNRHFIKIGHTAKNLGRGILRRIPGLRRFVNANWLKTESLPGEEHVIFEQLRVEMEALTGYVTRLHVYESKVEKFRKLQRRISKSIEQTEVPKAETAKEWTTFTYGELKIDSVKTAKYQLTCYESVGDWGIYAGNLQIASLLTCAKKETTDEEKNKILQNVQVLVGVIKNNTTPRSKSRGEQLSYYRLYEGDFVELLGMYSPPSYFCKPSRFTTAGVALDSKNRPINDINALKLRSLQNEADNRTDDLLAPARAITPNPDFIDPFPRNPLPAFFSMFESEWKEYNEDLRFGNHHPYSVRWEDYQPLMKIGKNPKFTKQGLHHYQNNVAWNQPPNEGNAAFDVEALNNPGYWFYLGYDRTRAQNPYPALSTVGLTLYILERVRNSMKSQEEMWRWLSKYPRDIGAEPTTFAGSWKSGETVRPSAAPATPATGGHR